MFYNKQHKTSAKWKIDKAWYVFVSVAVREQLMHSVGNKREAARADCADRSVSYCPDAFNVHALFKTAVVAQQCTSVQLIRVD